MRFAHIADCHLGGWKQPELQQLNLESFRKAIDTCISNKIDFILLSGDLFDSAYPPIETLKETFAEFKRLKEQKIRVFIIAGSHDYSASGKTFLDVLEKAGFCEICKFSEDSEGKLNLKEQRYENLSIFGYSGRKSGLEIEDLRKISIKETGNFKILMLHTTMTSAKGTLPIESISVEELPEADYYALGHLHLAHEYKISDNKYLIYPGPLFPNNFQELEELKQGSFYIVDINGYISLKKINIKLKEVLVLKINIENAITATEKIISELDKQDLSEKIVLLKLRGILKQGKTSNINFQEIQEKAKEKGAVVLLKSTSKLKTQETEIEIETDNIEKIEETVIQDFIKKNPSNFNELITPLLNSLNLEKQEGEKSAIFESRLLGEINKILNLEL